MAFRFRSAPIPASLLVLLSAATAGAGPAPPPPKHHPGHGASHASPHPSHASHSPHLKTAKLDAPPHRAAPGRSVGSPTDGHLVGGAHLTEAPYLRIVPAYAGGDARWGLEPLVGLIDHSARVVRKQFPDAVLSVGHLSRQGGGEIDRHASHESGRDADIGFYVRNQTAKPIYADHFVAFKGDGTASSWPGAQFDDPRNWALVAAIAGDGHARVTHIFVASPLRTRLLQYAEKVGAAPAIRNRAAELMAQPKGSLPHDDHFHVRIACPSGMEKCVEQPIARKHGKHHGAMAHNANANGNGSSASASAHHQQHTKPLGSPHPPGHGHAPPPPHAHPPAHHPAAPAPSESRDDSDANSNSSKNDALVPSLAPMVPGLDSAVIPAPLVGERKPPADDTTKPPQPPIDDPDGILDRR